MNLKQSLAVLMLAGVAMMTAGWAQPSGREQPKATPAEKAAQTPAVLSAAQAFTRIKTLAGTWEMTDEDGKVHVALESKATSAGSVLREVMFPGADHEMTNMYHLDGETIIATHYCAIGNQPRMVCSDFSKPGVYHFTFKDVTNRAAPEDMYMGELTLTIIDADTIKQHWVHFVKGERGGEVTFDMRRRPTVKAGPEPKPAAGS